MNDGTLLVSLFLSVCFINWETEDCQGLGTMQVTAWLFSSSKYKLRGVEVRWEGGLRNLSSKTGLENGTHRI